MCEDYRQLEEWLENFGKTIDDPQILSLDPQVFSG
jgi:hypothetical protein